MDLKLGEVTSLIIFYNIAISWLYPPNGFQFNFVLRDSASQESRGDPKSRNDGTVESRNGGKLPQILKDGIVESRNGGKYPQILKDGIAESRNGGKYPQILKDGMTENHPKS